MVAFLHIQIYSGQFFSHRGLTCQSHSPCRDFIRSVCHTTSDRHSLCHSSGKSSAHSSSSSISASRCILLNIATAGVDVVILRASVMITLVLVSLSVTMKCISVPIGIVIAFASWPNQLNLLEVWWMAPLDSSCLWSTGAWGLATLAVFTILIFQTSFS